MTNDTFPKLILPEDFDERAESEAEMKGYLKASVQMEKGRIYDVYFAEYFRLGQDLERYAEAGKPYFVEPGLIVMREITIAGIKDALPQIAAEGFFESLMPIK